MRHDLALARTWRATRRARAAGLAHAARMARPLRIEVPVETLVTRVGIGAAIVALVLVPGRAVLQLVKAL